MTESERRKNKLDEYLNSEDYVEKLLNRAKINDACERSTEAKVYAVAACKADPVFFFNNFAWTPNDKYEQYNFPFILFPFQEDLIYWFKDKIDKGEDGLVEKSREMGATWAIMSLFYWYWLFADNFNALVGSYKQEIVDDRTKDSLFGMLDYQIMNTPKWMLPKRYKHKNHRTQMKLINPENFNVIKGDTMSKTFGRGSRRTVIFMDEGAHWDYFDDAWTSAGDTTNSRMTVSTPYGYNAFALMRKESGMDVKTLHWSEHPLKDKEWYEYEKERRTAEELAQEVDISYNKSQKGRVYPEWDNVEKDDFPYDPELPVYVSWDFGRSDDTAIIWAQRDNSTGLVTIIDTYSNNGKLIDFYVPFITGIIPSDGYTYNDREFEMIEKHKYWNNGTHFGDPAGRFQNQVINKTVIDVLKDNNIHVNFRDEWKQFDKRINASKLLMRDNLRLNKNLWTDKLDICMMNSQYQEVQRGGGSYINSQGNKPRHDQYSHLRSAFEYLALGLSDYSNRSRKVYDKIKRKNDNRTSRTISY